MLVSGRSFLVFLLLLVVAALAIGLAPERAKQASGPAGSSFATDPDGARASYLLLGALGHRVERRAEPLGHLGKARLAFVLAPAVQLENADLMGLAEWVEGGGTLVYGVTVLPLLADPLNRALRLRDMTATQMSLTAVPLVANNGGPGRALGLRLRVELGSALDSSPLAQFVDKSWALRIKRGDGAVILLDAGAFSNGGLKEFDNALFLASLAADHAGGEPIVFDEFSHGFGDAVSLLAVARWPLRAAVGIGGLALLLYALAVGRRMGPAVAETHPPRPASLAQIEALASFYAAHHQREQALRTLAGSAVRHPHSSAGFSARAATVSPGLPPRTDNDLVRAAERLLPPGRVRSI